MSVKVLLVDDHPVFMAGIRAILDNEAGISIEGEAKDGFEAVRMVKEKRPDVVVMDITMPNLNGIDATKQILELSADTKVLALSIHSGRRFVKNTILFCRPARWSRLREVCLRPSSLPSL